MRTRWLGLILIGVCSSAVAAPPAIVNPLLAIDQNRATVVDRIVAEWGNPLSQSAAGLSPDQLRTMLGGLRADHLLAASLAGSLGGLRDVVSNAVSAAASGKSDIVRGKSIGDTANDVVYTPVTPCRLVETRTAYAAVYHGAGPFAGGTIRDYVVQGGNGVCLSQLPSGLGAAAVQLQVFGIPINAASNGDVEILPQGSTFGNTSTEVYVGNVLINTVSTVTKINPTNNTISVQVRGGGADLAIDVVGYFRTPTNFANSAATGLFATVGGGSDNTSNASYATVSGGYNNMASGYASAVVGGQTNASTGNYATTAGVFNTAGGHASVVAGGQNNVASGSYSVIPGGFGNIATGQFSVAAGYNAQSGYDGCFTYGDMSTTNPVNCGATNQFIVRSLGGVFLFTGGSTNSGPTMYTGARLAPGATAWTTYSDRNGKNNIRAVDSMAILRKVAAMPIATWNWNAQDATIRHMGPMAQDFHAAFDLGETPLGISTVDADGVALAAIQGLHRMIRQKDARLAQQSARLNQQAETITAMQRRLDAISSKLGMN